MLCDTDNLLGYLYKAVLLPHQCVHEKAGTLTVNYQANINSLSLTTTNSSIH